MPKTIRVKYRTYVILRYLKEKYGARSFDEVIMKLITRELDLPSDMFGIDRGKIFPFNVDDRMKDRE